MAVRLRELLADPELELRLLTGDPDTAATWAHSSDLPDPTPFLEAGNLLLTTGTQFADDAPEGAFAEYVARLRGRGVDALGFGTEVVRSGTPRRLIEACERSGQALVEVPYRTPFIAIARRVADELATAAHARDTWTLEAQRALSLAALSPARIAGVLDELARRLSAPVLLIDAHGELLSRHGRRLPATEEVAVAADAHRLLRRRLRTGAALPAPGHAVFLQTLGRRDELRGALAVALADRPDAAATAVITSAVALAEFALDDASRQHEATMTLHAQLLGLVLAGQPDAADAVLAVSGRPLPATGLRVLVTRLARAATADLRHTVDLRSARQGALVAPWDDVVAVIATGDVVTGVAAELVAAERVRVAISGEADWSQLPAALRDARDRFDRSGVVEVAELTRSDVLALLPAEPTAELAARRLAPLLADAADRALIETLRTWLRHHGAWEPAARELGVHRHTLKHQVREAGRLIDLDLDRFAARAELWILLESLRPGPSR